MAPSAEEFRAALWGRFADAERRGSTEIVVLAGDLHLEVGGYTNGGDHRMPVCCGVMDAEARRGRATDVHRPPRGRGASLEIRYQLPRPPIR